jgi:hypothetical protein
MAELTPEQRRLKALVDARTAGADEFTDSDTSSATKPEKPAKPKKKKSTLSFDYPTMSQQSGFDVSGKLKPFRTPKGRDTKVPDFITGGTPAQKKALARKIANLTIHGDMSAADIAKIKKARLWYTGQTKGGGKQRPATYKKDSVKEALMGPAPKPSKNQLDVNNPLDKPGPKDRERRTVVNMNGDPAPPGYYFNEKGQARPVETADQTVEKTSDWLTNGGKTTKRNRNKRI